MHNIASDIAHSQDFVFIALFIYRLLQAIICFLAQEESLQLSIALLYAKIYAIAYLYSQAMFLYNIHSESSKYPLLWLIKAFSVLKYDNSW